MVSKSALKGYSRLLGRINSHLNKSPWTGAMVLFGAVVLLAFSSFVLTGNLAFAQNEPVTNKSVLMALLESGFVGLLIILMSIVGGALA
ncbi:MAG: hypothetical protein MK138_07420, partial [Planctomycetes bacterium]|nr:hypothetical protein [Planctomycetota bacterium]